jgi:hypothetical protein
MKSGKVGLESREKDIKNHIAAVGDETKIKQNNIPRRFFFHHKSGRLIVAAGTEHSGHN